MFPPLSSKKKPPQHTSFPSHMAIYIDFAWVDKAFDNYLPASPLSFREPLVQWDFIDSWRILLRTNFFYIVCLVCMTGNNIILLLRMQSRRKKTRQAQTYGFFWVCFDD
jgi:hypothetical protein